jgi:uncharacterized protein YndB with AHSA1/START domain
MRKGTSGSAVVTVEATPEEVYDLVTNVRRIPEWSPECTHARWLGNADGPEVGARFEGRNQRGAIRWVTRPRVVAAERPHQFAFVMRLPVFGDLTRWRYEIEPGERPGTSRVTESFAMVRDLPFVIDLFERVVLRIPDRQKDLQENLETSLERLRGLLEGRDAQSR